MEKKGPYKPGWLWAESQGWSNPYHWARAPFSYDPPTTTMGTGLGNCLATFCTKEWIQI